MNIETLKSYYQQYGWEIIEFEDMILTGVETDNSKFTLISKANEQWISFHIPDFILDPAPLDPKAFAESLLILNNTSEAVRISYTPEASMALSLDLPSTNSSYELFAFGLNTILDYANTVYPMIHRIMNTSERV